MELLIFFRGNTLCVVFFSYLCKLDYIIIMD